MVSSVGSISIDLSTNTAKFADGFKRAATTVERESSRMSKAVNGFASTSAGLLKSFGSGFVGGIVGSLGIGTLDAALGKVNESLHRFEDIGIKAKASGLNAEFFQALSFAANETDVEQESLNKSMEIFAKNVGLAKEGTGALYSSMIKLNPVLLQQILYAKDQETRLKLVADAMKQLSDPTDRAALAVATFGKGGADMVRVLEGGAGALNDFAAQAQKLGIIFTDDDIKRWGEAADRVDRLGFVWNIKFAKVLADSAPLIEGGITQLANFTTKVNELGAATNKFVDSPSFETFLEMMVGKGAADFLTGTDAAVNRLDELQKELVEAQKDLGTMMKRAGEEGMTGSLRAAIDATIVRIKELKQQIVDTGNAAVTAGDQVRRALLAQQFRAAEIASMAAMPAGGGGGGGPKLPNVYQGTQLVGAGGNAIDPETGEKIERAIEKETEATNRVAARATDVYRGVQQFDAHSAGYFDRLGSQIDSGLQSVGRALSYNVPAGGGYATSGANSFRYSGNNSSGSWAGKRMTFGGGGGSSGITSAFGKPYAMGGGSIEDASSITSGATGTTSGAINVNVVVKPILEGSRLSGQSVSEIKQAASAGANAALRAYYGR
jgi:hypothetical protein